MAPINSHQQHRSQQGARISHGGAGRSGSSASSAAHQHTSIAAAPGSDEGGGEPETRTGAVRPGTGGVSRSGARQESVDMQNNLASDVSAAESVEPAFKRGNCQRGHEGRDVATCRQQTPLRTPGEGLPPPPATGSGRIGAPVRRRRSSLVLDPASMSAALALVAGDSVPLLTAAEAAAAGELPPRSL